VGLAYAKIVQCFERREKSMIEKQTAFSGRITMDIRPNISVGDDAMSAARRLQEK